MIRSIRHFIRFLLFTLVFIAAALLISHRFSTPIRGNHTLTVMTWNTLRFDQAAAPERNRVLEYLRTHPADIICLEEAEVSKESRGLNLNEVKSALVEQYPYSYVDFKLYRGKTRRYGLMVFSRYPLINKESVHYESEANSSARCDVVVDYDTLRLIVNHLESNRLVQADWADSLSRDEIRRKSERIGGKLHRAEKLRWTQAGIVRQEINASPYPVIVAGDFNSLPLSRVYLRLRFGGLPWLTDSFLAGSRFRLGKTMAYHHLPLRIDYILTSRTLHVLSSEVDYSAVGSDHFPLTTILTW